MNSLHDAHGRRFHYLRLSLTEACNFKCGYCLPNGYSKVNDAPEPLSVPEIRRLVTALSEIGLRKIRLTGGEPTLRRDLIEIIQTVRAIPTVTQIALTTNGHLLQKNARSYREAGVTALNVSADSLDRVRFREITGMDRLPEVLAGIEEALALDFPRVKLNAVLLKDMEPSELESFMEFASARLVTVRFIELMRTNDHAAYFEKNHISADWIRRRLLGEGWTRVERAADAGPAEEYAHPHSLGRIGLITPYGKDFCSTCNRLRVSSTGDLRLCLFGEGRTALRPLLQSDDQKEEVIRRLRQSIGDKAPTHLLHEGNAGKTRNFSEIGG